jgi:hypothetical protein
MRSVIYNTDDISVLTSKNMSTPISVKLLNEIKREKL